MTRDKWKWLLAVRREISLAEVAIPTMGIRPEYYEMVQRLMDLYGYISNIDKPKFGK